MIELVDLSIRFSAGTVQETTALDQVSLRIGKGEFLVQVGSNGSGKSTLLNALAGTVPADEGKILFHHQDVTNLQEYQRSKWIARVFQNPLAGTAPDLSVMDNFRLASLRTKRKGLKLGINRKFREDVKERIGMLRLGLEDKTDMMMGRLSGGQRQALTLLMAVMDEAGILLMDEPAAALDPKTALLIMNLAERIIHDYQLTAILVTHQLKDAIRYGNRMIQLQEGHIIRDLAEAEKQSLSVPDLYQWF